MKIYNTEASLTQIFEILNLEVPKAIDPTLQNYIFFQTESIEECTSLSNRIVSQLQKYHVSDYRIIIDSERIVIENGACFTSCVQQWSATQPNQEAAQRILNCYYNNLDTLDLSNLEITTFPPLKGLFQLKSLKLTNNQIHAIPEGNFFFPNLEECDLKGNHLTSLPEDLSISSKLVYLNLANNSFKKIPSVVFSLQNLHVLNISNCQLREIPSSIRFLSRLSNLELENNQISSIASEIENLNELIQMNLCSNRLSNIPLSIFNLKKLLWLSLKNNSIRTIPSLISKLDHLKYLFLSCNQINKIPDSIFSMQSLKALDLSDNQISTFGIFNEISMGSDDLKNLEELNLSSNRLTQLPSDCSTLFSGLIELDVSDNPGLKVLPLSLGRCQELTHLLCENNSISPEIIDAILVEASSRKNFSSNILEKLIAKWSCCAEKEPFLFQFEDFDEQMTQTLVSWLERCESVNEMFYSQKQYTQVILDMLKSLEKQTSYRQIFFSQLSLNNSNCEDRTSTSNGHLYGLWQIEYQLKEQSSLYEKLKLAAGIAKTLLLRKRISQLISEKEQLLGGPLNEQTEIYLFAETELKPRLDLKTICDSMFYPEIGDVEWICLDEIEAYIKENFLKEMSSMDFIGDLARRESPDVNEKLDSLNLSLQKDLTEVENPTSSKSYLELSKNLLNEYELKKSLIISNWIKENNIR